MNKLRALILLGEGYFGTGGRTTDEFKQFFRDFKKAFKKELKELDATEIEFSGGHFDLTGFFRVGEQLIYFSLSDVRWSVGGDAGRLLVRTAKHNKDWTGGGNNYVEIEDGIAESIKRKFSF